MIEFGGKASGRGSTPDWRTRRSAPVATHAIFVPALTIWAASLFGLAILVMPRAYGIIIGGMIGLGNAGPNIVAALFAVIGACLGFGAAVAYRKALAPRRRKENPQIDEHIADLADWSDPEPTESHDDALPELEPVEFDPAEIQEHVEPPISADTSDFQEDSHPTVPAKPAAEPIGLSLDEFAQLPGRNGVWVDEAAEEHLVEEEPVIAQTVPTENPQQEPEHPRVPKAVRHLRSVESNDLSLLQMVERFAVALHEYQDNADRRSADCQQPARDAALAEALKALGILTGEVEETRKTVTAGPRDGSTRDELREALAKLQQLKGAA